MKTCFFFVFFFNFLYVRQKCSGFIKRGRFFSKTHIPLLGLKRPRWLFFKTPGFEIFCKENPERDFLKVVTKKTFFQKKSKKNFFRIFRPPLVKKHVFSQFQKMIFPNTFFFQKNPIFTIARGKKQKKTHVFPKKRVPWYESLFSWKNNNTFWHFLEVRKYVVQKMESLFYQKHGGFVSKRKKTPKCLNP